VLDKYLIGFWGHIFNAICSMHRLKLFDCHRVCLFELPAVNIRINIGLNAFCYCILTLTACKNCGG